MGILTSGKHVEIVALLAGDFAGARENSSNGSYLCEPFLALVTQKKRSYLSKERTGKTP